MRAIMEEEKVRNTILAEALPSDIILGPTFTGEYSLIDVKAYTKSLFTSPKIHLFTVSNRPDLETGETHFQTFVYTNKTLYVGDPAYKRVSTNGKIENKGIYEAKIGNYLMELATKNDVKTEWIRLTSPCQTSFDDVFCQTWSLLIQLEFVKNGFNMPIEIPCAKDKRYDILLDSYKELLKLPLIQKRLKEEYVYSIKHADEVGVEIEASDMKKLLRANPVSRLQSMTVKDMY
jgi:phosphoribosylaminoimidazole-succinocarboxamide synthase